MTRHTAIAFGLAIPICATWIVLILFIFRVTGTTPLIHIAALSSVIVLAAGFQFIATRGLLIAPFRRVVQVAVASVLAPSIACTFVYLAWVVVLGQGE